MVFKALRTYSDGTIVRWIDPIVAGQAEPDHPAPVLTLTTSGGGDAQAAATDGASAAPAAASSTTSSSGTAALVVAIIAAVLGAGGATLGGLAFARGRRTA